MTGDEATTLPEQMRSYAERNVPDPGARPSGVIVGQTGEMRLSPKGRTLSFTAVEELAVAEVAFSWRARFSLVPLVWLDVTDEYAGQAGGLRARLWGKLRVMSSVGPAMAEAEACRYLAELPWCRTRS